MRILTTALGMSVLVGGCHRTTSPPPFPAASTYETIVLPRTADSVARMQPISDLKLALSRGDRHFLGLYGFATYAPGIDRRAECIRQGGIKVVVGTSETIRSYAFDVWQKAVFDYAKAYNEALAAHFRADAPSSCPGRPMSYIVQYNAPYHALGAVNRAQLPDGRHHMLSAGCRSSANR